MDTVMITLLNAIKYDNVFMLRCCFPRDGVLWEVCETYLKD
jgi:hypothetical protein